MSRPEIKLSRLLRELLAQEADPQFQTPSMMAAGAVTNGHVIAVEVVKAACMGKEWAIQLVTERTEGKATQATKDDTSDRSTEEALDDVTRKRLNDLAGVVTGQQPAAAGPAVNADSKPATEDRGADKDAARPTDDAAPTTRRLLDLPKDRDRHPKDRTREP